MSKFSDWVAHIIERLAERDFVSENVKMRAEIEKLKDEAIHNEGVMVALKEGYEERGVELENLKEHNDRLGWQSKALIDVNADLNAKIKQLEEDI